MNSITDNENIRIIKAAVEALESLPQEVSIFSTTPDVNLVVKRKQVVLLPRPIPMSAGGGTILKVVLIVNLHVTLNDQSYVIDATQYKGMFNVAHYILKISLKGKHSSYRQIARELADGYARFAQQHLDLCNTVYTSMTNKSVSGITH